MDTTPQHQTTTTLATDTIGSSEKCVKLVKATEDQVLLCPAGFDELQRLSPLEPANLVAVLGHGRTGKSWFANYLASELSSKKLKTNPPFLAQGGYLPCTTGVEVLLTPLTLDHSSFLLMDVEGNGEESSQHDILITVPVLVVSQIILYHTTFKKREHCLQDLGIWCTSLETLVESLNVKLGHLWILLRDQADASSDASASWETYLMDLEVELESSSRDLKERNRLRSLLRKLFIDVRCMVLPPSCPLELLGTSVSASYSHVTVAWTTAIHNLCVALPSQFHPAITLADTDLRREQVYSTWKAAYDCLRNGVFLSPSLLRATYHCLEQETNLISSFRDETTVQDVFWTDASLECELKRLSEHCLAQFEKNCQHSPQDILITYRERLQASLKTVSELAISENNARRIKHVQAALDKVTADFINTLAATPYISLEQIQRNFRGAINEELDPEQQFAPNQKGFAEMYDQYLSKICKVAAAYKILSDKREDASSMELTRGLSMAAIYLKIGSHALARETLALVQPPFHDCRMFDAFVSMLYKCGEEARALSLIRQGWVVFQDELIKTDPNNLILLLREACKRKSLPDCQKVYRMALKEATWRGLGKFCASYGWEMFEAHLLPLQEIDKIFQQALLDHPLEYHVHHFYARFLLEQKPCKFEEAKQTLESANALQLTLEERLKLYHNCIVFLLQDEPKFVAYAEEILETQFLNKVEFGAGTTVLLVAFANHYLHSNGKPTPTALMKAKRVLELGQRNDFAVDHNDAHHRSFGMAIYAELLAMEDKVEEAEVWFRKALASKPVYHGAMLKYSEFLVEQGRDREVEELLKSFTNVRDLKAIL